MIDHIRVCLASGWREVIQVTLTKDIYRWAKFAGDIRQEWAVKNNVDNKRGATRKSDIDEVGAIGECVAAIALDVNWMGPGRFKDYDIGGRFQVRTTRHSSGRLRIDPEDKNEDIFIAVNGCSDPYTWYVTGWLLGKEGKDPEYLTDFGHSERLSADGGGKVFGVPLAMTHHINTLKVR
jgi:hypothetical protein